MKASRIDWEKPSHFIASEYCRFGQSTAIPGYIISSVGDYVPHHKGEQAPIGYQRTYETMVFRWNGKKCVDKDCDCGGVPLVEKFRELDMIGANDPATCKANHEKLVTKWTAVARRKHAQKARA